MRSSGWLVLPAALAAAACDSTPPEPRRTTFIIGGERPTTLIRPRDYVDGTPIPVVLVLHGYGGNWAGIDRYFGISRRVNRDRFAVIHPSGTLNPAGRRFWDATDYCCDFWESDPDDVGYLDDLIEEAGEYVTVGGAYLIGLSNGGFMSYRMACESMPKLRGIVNLAGSSFHDANRCAGARAVPVLHIHGTADAVIRYDGGSRAGGARYPGARETVERWASRAGCDVEAADTLEPLDLVADIPGDETTALRYRTGCGAGITVELWTIRDGPHVPRFNSSRIGGVLTAWLFG